MNQHVEDTTALAADLQLLMREVQVLCGKLDESLLDELSSAEESFTDDELRELLTEVLVRLRAGGSVIDRETRVKLATEVRSLVERAVQARNDGLNLQGADPASERPTDGEIGPAATGRDGDGPPQHLRLFNYAGLPCRPVRPIPVFLGSEVPLLEGFVNTRDINFWEANTRLEVDLENFRRREGRDPDREELKQMLWPRGRTQRNDVYDIKELADDIAARGVQQPPVIDHWGTAWDGNRRLAACLFILENDYTAEQKERASKVRVWQTDEHATEDQIRAIVTSLNFSKEFKKPWDEYIRAKKIFEAFNEEYELEASHHHVTDNGERKIRKTVADKFGIKTSAVTRFCRMMQWAQDFEDFHREQGRDESEILVRTNQKFQYFYELDSGRGEDKLATKLDKDDAFRAITFDLIFDDKIRNFAQVRELRRVYDTPDAMDLLMQAHADANSSTGRTLVDEAISAARRNVVAIRQAGRSDELARISKWLEEDVTMAVLRKIDSDVLRRFRDAARGVDGMITSVVDPEPGPRSGDEQ